MAELQPSKLATRVRLPPSARMVRSTKGRVVVGKSKVGRVEAVVQDPQLLLIPVRLDVGSGGSFDLPAGTTAEQVVSVYRVNQNLVEVWVFTDGRVEHV